MCVVGAARRLALSAPTPARGGHQCERVVGAAKIEGDVDQIAHLGAVVAGQRRTDGGTRACTAARSTFTGHLCGLRHQTWNNADGDMMPAGAGSGPLGQWRKVGECLFSDALAPSVRQ